MADSCPSQDVCADIEIHDGRPRSCPHRLSLFTHLAFALNYRAWRSLTKRISKDSPKFGNDASVSSSIRYRSRAQHGIEVLQLWLVGWCRSGCRARAIAPKVVNYDAASYYAVGWLCCRSRLAATHHSIRYQVMFLGASMFNQFVKGEHFDILLIFTIHISGCVVMCTDDYDLPELGSCRYS